ncbi:MAG: FAD-binding protein [Thermodesulfobacteriota bacterium]
MKTPCEAIQTDVLILGAGAAGIRASLAAVREGAEVTVVSRGPATRCGSSFSPLSGGWGIQALAGEECTEKRLEDFYDEILQAGLGMADPKLARILVEESGPRLEDLMSYGLRFRRNSQGAYVRVKGCFSECERAFLTEARQNIKDVFLKMLDRSGAKAMTGYAVDLIVREGICLGAWVLTPGATLVGVTAGATLLATGGGAGIFQDHLVTDDEVGDGYALAHRAGAEMNNMEFIQFMLGLRGDGIRRFLPLSELKRPRVILDSDGDDLLKMAIPDEEDRLGACEERINHHPFSTRDRSSLIDLAVARACSGEGKVFWAGEGDRDRRLEVAHFSHAFNGGIRIDETGESTVPCLFAAGEVAAGPHGADRIGGCMMTATQVFGERAGKYAARRARENAGPAEPSSSDSCLSFLDPGSRSRKSFLREICGAGKALCEQYLKVLRDRKGLDLCLSGLQALGENLEKGGPYAVADLGAYISARSLLTTARLVAEGASRRTDSLGSHFRIDDLQCP